MNSSQQLFLKIWEQRERWVIRDPIRTYLYGATRNRALDHLKHQHVRECAVRKRESG